MSTAFFDLAIVLNALENPFGFFAVICAIAAGLGYVRKSYGLTFFLSVGLVFATTHILKSIFKVPRPEGALVDAVGYRFPSMHAAIAGACLGSLAWHFYTRTRHTWVKVAMSTVALALLALVGSTRLLLGVHEMVDVVVGALLGISIALIVHALIARAGLE